MVSLSAVILSGVAVSRSEAAAESKDLSELGVNSQQRGAVADRIVPEELDTALMNVI
jgi:hypothetical protein